MDGFPGRGGALQCQAQQIHPQQALLRFLRATGSLGLIPDGQALFIYAHLKTPDPIGLGAQHTVRAFRLGDRQMGAPQLFPCGVASAGNIHQGLRLAQRSVTVFGKQVLSPGIGAFAQGECIAREHYATSFPLYRNYFSALCSPTWIWAARTAASCSAVGFFPKTVPRI